MFSIEGERLQNTSLANIVWIAIVTLFIRKCIYPILAGETALRPANRNLKCILLTIFDLVAVHWLPHVLSQNIRIAFSARKFICILYSKYTHTHTHTYVYKFYAHLCICAFFTSFRQALSVKLKKINIPQISAYVFRSKDLGQGLKLPCIWMEASSEHWKAAKKKDWHKNIK